MTLIKRIEYSEKDIEDWMWENVDKIEIVDEWIDRQLTLRNGGIIDLLGIKKRYDHHKLVLIELKSNDIQMKDFFQVARYREHLIDTIEQSGVLSFYFDTYLIGTDQQTSLELYEYGRCLDIHICSVGFNKKNELDISGVWYYDDDYCDSLNNKQNQLMKSGKLDNLTDYLLAKMPKEIYDICKEKVMELRRPN